MSKTAHHVYMLLHGHSYGIIAAFAMIMIFAGSPIIAAQSSQVGAQVVWMNDPDEVIVRDTYGNSIRSDFGLMLDRGSTLQTRNSSAELVLVPNGSVIVIADHTIFHIDSLHGVDPVPGQNAFSLLTGKLRFIAAKSDVSSYSVRTQTAVAGVRGTDFYRMYDPDKGRDWLCVTEGKVQFDPPTGKQGVLVPAGSFVNLNNGFLIAQPDDNWLKANLTLETLHRAALPPRR